MNDLVSNENIVKAFKLWILKYHYIIFKHAGYSKKFDEFILYNLDKISSQTWRSWEFDIFDVCSKMNAIGRHFSANIVQNSPKNMAKKENRQIIMPFFQYLFSYVYYLK
ncbi:hypothetical protein HZS_2574 [Henneguya salminicola]|nr:hypothetical protein HZS_2574 [Henneguya salminicola]